MCMDQWTYESAARSIYAFDDLSGQQQESLIRYCNEKFPPSVFHRNLQRRRRAIANAQRAREALTGVVQRFPPLISGKSPESAPRDLDNTAIVLTAGGEGERLKKSLLDRGKSDADLKDFTKATYPLTGFYNDFGALQANLSLIASLCNRHGLAIPVVVTTGPKGSATARVVPAIIDRHHGFGLKHLLLVEQEERLHLTADEKIAYTITEGLVRPVTNPDETGGPLMKLKSWGEKGGGGILEGLKGLGCTKVLVLQATGLYDPSLLFSMAKALTQYDCIGVGILRTTFDAKDPFGTYVSIANNNAGKLVIVEQEIRNETTLRLTDETGRYHLPYNTGLYGLKSEVLANGELPDYATPPKEVLPGIPRSPKIGFAATDIFSLSDNAAVLSVPENAFAVIKSAEDLARLSDLGKRYGILEMCRAIG